MAGNDADFMTALDSRVDDILDRCTKCGRCVEVCPMPAPAGLDPANAKDIARGVLDILRTGTGTEASETWASVCTGSGHCIDACDDGVNPRFMLAMARVAMQRAKNGEAAVRREGADRYRGMTRGVRVLSRLQLPPELLHRLGPVTERDEPENPDIVFYTGCNILRTPHIALLCLDVLDALGASYQVMGGPTHCCGVYQFQLGDPRNSGRLAGSTIDQLASGGTSEVLSWCPSCQVQLGDFALPTYERATGTKPFDLVPFVKFLESRLDDLRALMVNSVSKRVGLHEHPGVPGITEAARHILEAIPGLEFVDLEQPRVGYMCNTLNVMPEFKRDVHAAQLEAAEAEGVDTLAGIYHACHRDLCSHERDWPFEVVNFMELIGESMGFHRADLFKRLKIMQNADKIIAETADMIADYGLDPDEVRAVIVGDMLGEQALPLGRDYQSGLPARA